MVFKRLNINVFRQHKTDVVKQTATRLDGHPQDGRLPVRAQTALQGIMSAHVDARTRAERVTEEAAEKRRRRLTTDNATVDAAFAKEATEKPSEYGGPKGLEPTRYGDWEKAGRCFDF